MSKVASKHPINSNRFHRGCLSATSMKLIALICMTIDHMGAYGFNIPVMVGHIDNSRIVGRIAAPIFLYAAVESLKKTGNKKKYLFRLYLASVVIGSANLFVSALWGMTISFGNMVQSLFLTILFLWFLEMEVDLYKKKHYKKFLQYAMLFLMIICGATLFDKVMWNDDMLLRWLNWRENRIGAEYVNFFRHAVNIFIIEPRRIMYFKWIIVLGICWYFTNSKKAHVICFLIICLLSMFLIQGNQWRMILATPIILLYNGEYGKGRKWFFYAYYPIHCYIIAFINTLY
ncbi:MAG: conjugal transfer protein TraX [Lachnospiraceae bacterium]|nr:conjugal transfer protein TraX [Lachnospiraceae bacterium]